MKPVFIEVIAVFVISCSTRNETLRIVLDNGGYVIAPYIVVNNDTLLDGVAFYYRDDHKLKSRTSYVKGRKSGVEITFDSSAQVESEINFKDDLENGHGYFYKNGTIDQQVYYKSGNAIYAQRFNSNGSRKLINVFNIGFQRRDSLDYVQYVIRFDSTGRQTFEGGYVFSPNYFYSTNRDSVKINSPLEIQFVVTILPDHKTVIKMGQIGPAGSLNQLQVLPVDNYYAHYQQTFADTGKKFLVTIGELYDKAGKLIKKDSMTSIVTVHL